MENNYFLSPKTGATFTLRLIRKLSLHSQNYMIMLDCYTLQEHQSILTNATVSKDSEIGILMVVYENFFLLISSVSKN